MRALGKIRKVRLRNFELYWNVKASIQARKHSCRLSSTLSICLPSSWLNGSKPLSCTQPTSFISCHHVAIRCYSCKSLDATYPHYVPDASIVTQREFIELHAPFANGTWATNRHGVPVSLVGRVHSKRESGKNLAFLDLVRSGHSVQIVLRRNDFGGDDECFTTCLSRVHPGCTIQVSGLPGRTKAGELSLKASFLKVLAPAIRPFDQLEGIKDENYLIRRPYLAMLLKVKHLSTTLKTRAKIVDVMRQFFRERNFLEVETPILSTKAGGANAKPFVTHLNNLDASMQLRISPELYLKQLVVGGLEKVFEIGKQFRNEGIDATHNPEFTTCEAYHAFGDLECMLQLTESLIRHVVGNVCEGSHLLPWRSNDAKNALTLNFLKPFQRIELVPELKRKLDVSSLPDLNHPSSVEFLHSQCQKHGIAVSGAKTPPRLLDKLISALIEPDCVQPTFLLGHPLCMSPLAKARTELVEATEVSDRFELIVGKSELANGYVELNDPREQRARFAEQKTFRDAGDDEACGLNDEFCEALEYGLPPTVGLGIGIDRLCMLVSGIPKIRDVLAFPLHRPST